MADIEHLLSLIDDTEVIQLAQDMVRIPSLTHREGPGMLRFLEKWFKDLDIPCRIYPCSGDRGNFFADYGAVEGPRRYLFNGHMDTKPVDGMTVDPYGAVIEDGRMYGRGACDMKGALAGFLCAFKALVRAGHTPKGGITFYSDIEEEFSGPDGFLSIIEKGLCDGYEGVISGEPTKLDIHIGNMGAIATAFEVKGKAAHASMPHLGVNAIHHTARFVTEYLKLPYGRAMNPYFGKPTINFEKIDGGREWEGTVPDRCVVCIDTRLIPETPPERVREELDGLIARLGRDEGIDITEVDPPKDWRPRRGQAPAAYIEHDHPLIRRTEEAFRRAMGKEPVISAMPGATFAGVMIRRGTPGVLCGPGSIEQAHTEDEWVEVAQLPQAARIYTALMAEM